MHHKEVDWLADSEDPDLGLHYLLRPNCPNFRILLIIYVQEIYQTKKETHTEDSYRRLFLFLELDNMINIFQLLIWFNSYSSLIAKSSTSLCLRNHLILLGSESAIDTEIREESKWNVTNVSTWSMATVRVQITDTLYTIDNII